MSLGNFFRQECIITKACPKNKEEALLEVAKTAKRCPVLSDFPLEKLLKGLKEREKIGSTGFGKGIAIPHCTSDKINDFVVGLITVPDGVEFEAFDGKPVKLIFFIIGSSSDRNEHIHLLSGISRLLMEDGFSKTLIEETNAEPLYQLINSKIMGELDTHYHADRTSEPKCDFTVYVQKEEFFVPILEIFSEIDDISIMLYNGENINQYLYRLPLFAAFWIDEQTTFNKVIKAVVNRSISNELVRRIDTITGGINQENPGIMITVEDVQFSKGKLDF